MSKPIKQVLLVLGVALAAMLFGQLYYNGRPIANRLSTTVGQPQGYEIVADTSADVAYYGRILGKKIPIWFHDARVTVANWLYPQGSVKAPAEKD